MNNIFTIPLTNNLIIKQTYLWSSIIIVWSASSERYKRSTPQLHAEVATIFTVKTEISPIL